MVALTGCAFSIILFALAVVLFFVLKKRIFIYWLCPGGIVWQKDDEVHFGLWEDVCLFQPKVTKVIEEKETFFDDQPKSFDVHTCVTNPGADTVISKFPGERFGTL